MNNIEIKIDYLSATFPLDVDAEDSIVFKVHEMVRDMSNYLNVKNFEVAKSKFAQNNYNYQFMLGEFIILRLDGPMNDSYQKTCHLEMKGEACRDFERRNPDKTWISFILYMAELNCKFKRIDIAIDDFKGENVTIGWILEKINKKFYTSVFRSIPNPIGTMESGMTIQFGTHESPTELVIYDKKMERKKRKKACDKAYWVRYEMRFRNELADRIAYDLISEITEESIDIFDAKIHKFAFKQLYRILDIKVDNNYNSKSQNKVATDPKWKAFLDNVEKGSLAKLDNNKPNTFEQYMKAASPYISAWLLTKYVLSLRDSYVFELEIYKVMAEHLKFSKQRLKRINQYLKQLNLEPIDETDLLKISEEYKIILEEKELIA